ncbi:hypothetical protein LINPERHAP2_LOCUS4488 [Linum perenne]
MGMGLEFAVVVGGRRSPAVQIHLRWGPVRVQTAIGVVAAAGGSMVSDDIRDISRRDIVDHEPT